MKRFSFTLLVVAALLLASLLPGGLRGVYAQESGAPIGWHDGVEGTVDAANCSAFGWAVDPDNPDGDLQVRILVDDYPEPVATVTADQLREDVGACPGGTCGFGVNLWDLISHGEEHQITAQALDVETDTWVDLEGTPKSLTCFGYPEGFHDGAEGTVDEGACVASGWAADPDNRDRDLQVQILVDSNAEPVATVTADQLREDVGACPGGTCGFGVNLWDLISHGEEHQITAQAYDEETLAWRDLSATPKSLTCQAPPPPTPWLVAFPENDAVDGWEWPDGATVYLAIDDPATVASPDYTNQGTAAVTPSGDPRTYFRIDFAGAYNLKVGDVVVLTYGATQATHTVKNLGITNVDMAADTVAGTADAGAAVWVWPHGFDQTATVQATAGEDGTWLAAFAGLFDITFDTSGRSWIVDTNGNATAVDWSAPPPPPTPWLTAFPDREYVEAVEWAVGLPVHLTIDDPNTGEAPDYQADTTTVVPEWEGNPERGWALFPLAGYNLKAGDRVVMTGGEFMLEHIVRNLAVTSADIQADTVAGTADAGATVWVWPHGFDQTATVQATAGEDGAWQAEFAGLFDITFGTGGRSQVVDMNGNATAVGWSAPMPWLMAFPENEAVDGWEWPDGAIVYLAIDDPATVDSPDYTNQGTAAVTPWGDPRTYVRFDFADAYNLKVGDVVMLSHGATSITHVVKNLSVTSTNGAADFVAGTADPGALVWVWPHGFNQVATLQVTAGASGRWAADFAGVFDLVQWTSGRSQVFDEAGNATAVDWTVLAPPPSCVGAGCSVRLPADAVWMNSGFAVWEGAEIGLTARGEAVTARLRDYPDALSGPDGQITNCTDFDGNSPCALDGAPYGALLGKIGPDGEPFVIGSSLTFTPHSTGQLYLTVNDNLPYYEDNKGSYVVFVGQ